MKKILITVCALMTSAALFAGGAKDSRVEDNSTKVPGRRYRQETELNRMERRMGNRPEGYAVTIEGVLAVEDGIPYILHQEKRYILSPGIVYRLAFEQGFSAGARIKAVGTAFDTSERCPFGLNSQMLVPDSLEINGVVFDSDSLALPGRGGMKPGYMGGGMNRDLPKDAAPGMRRGRR